MFDVLVYLFENFANSGFFPESSVLTRKLAAVGFEEDEVSAALEWLSGLENLEHRVGQILPLPSNDTCGLRVYSHIEQSRLSVDCRSFLLYLEGQGVIDTTLRETIIEGALALEDEEVPLAQLKIIVLMVLWRQHSSIESLDVLLLEELLSPHEEPAIIH